MSFRITKGDERRLAALRDRLPTERGKYEDALRTFNERMAQLWTDFVEGPREAFDGTRCELLGIIEDVRDAQHEAFEDKSESWQESERGQQVQEWLDALDVIELEDDEIARPSAVDESAIPDDDQMFEDLPMAPEEV